MEAWPACVALAYLTDDRFPVWRIPNYVVIIMRTTSAGAPSAENEVAAATREEPAARISTKGDCASFVSRTRATRSGSRNLDIQSNEISGWLSRHAKQRGRFQEHFGTRCVEGTEFSRRTRANKGSSEVGGAQNLPLALEHRLELREEHCSVGVPERASGKAA